MDRRLSAIVDEAQFYATEILKLQEKTSAKNLQIGQEFQLLADNPPEDPVIGRKKLNGIRDKLSIDMLMHILPQYVPKNKL